MEYFCATCQEKHDTRDIAVDLYNICKLVIAPENEEGTLGEVKVKWVDEEKSITTLSQEFDALINYVRADKQLFQFSRQELEQLASPAKKPGETNWECCLSLDFSWLMGRYARYEENQSKKGIAPHPLNGIEKILKADANKRHAVLFSKWIEVVFAAYGEDETIDYIAPAGRKGPDAAVFNQDEITRVCPYCTRVLDKAIGHAPEVVIGVLGAPRAGKTSCMTAIADRLLKAGEDYFFRQNSKLCDTFLMDQATNRFREGYSVEKTPENLQETPTYSMLVEMDNTLRCVVTFVDMPGEFWSPTGREAGGYNQAFLEKYGDLLKYVDCIWLFVSKMGFIAARLDGASSESVTLEKLSGMAEVRAMLRDAAPEEIKHSIQHLISNDPKGMKELIVQLVEKYPDEFAKIHEDNLKRIAMTQDDSDTLKAVRAHFVEANLASLKGYLGSVPPLAVIITKSEMTYIDKANLRSGDEDVNDMLNYEVFSTRNTDGASIEKPECSWDENRKQIKDILTSTDRDIYPTDYFYYLNETEFYRRSSLIRKYMEDRGNEVVSAIENIVPDRCYFAMSAYGHPAASLQKNDDSGEQAGNSDTFINAWGENDNSDQYQLAAWIKEAVEKMMKEKIKAFQIDIEHKKSPPAPYRELYPLLWTLAITGWLPVKHTVSYLEMNGLQRMFNLGGNKREYERLFRFDQSHVPEANDDFNIWSDIRSILMMNADDRAGMVTEFNHPKGKTTWKGGEAYEL